jgi:hypothetical protein
MPDFSKLLRKPVDEAKKPNALPAADYPGIIKSFEIGDQNKNKTPYVRFHVALTGWPDSVSEDDKVQNDKPVDLAKRQLRRDFYLTDDADWRLAEFLKSCGISTAGRNFEETVPEAVGQAVLVEVQQYLNQTNSEIGNQIGKLVGAQG